MEIILKIKEPTYQILKLELNIEKDIKVIIVVCWHLASVLFELLFLHLVLLGSCFIKVTIELKKEIMYHVIKLAELLQTLMNLPRNGLLLLV